MARKLLNASAVDPPPICYPFCDKTKIPYGSCPDVCGGFCPPLCIPPPPLFEDPPPPPPPPPPIAVLHKSHGVSLALTISLSVLATLFFLFTCYTICKFCSNWYGSRRRRSPRPQEDSGPDGFLDEEHGPIVDHPIWYIRTIGLQPSVISAITVVNYKRGDGLIEGTDCSVCLNEFRDDETLRLLPKCNHAFHIPCIDTWLRSHTNCPLCRAGIVTNAAAPLPSQEPVVHNSGLAEENPLEISEHNRGFRRDSENESSDSRPGIEDDGLSRSQSGLKINEDTGGLDGVLPMRRSVSFDSLSASMISAAIADAFPGQSDRNSEVKESTVESGGQRVGSMQTAGTSSIKRSLSCSAKVFLSRHSSRNRNSQ